MDRIPGGVLHVQTNYDVRVHLEIVPYTYVIDPEDVCYVRKDGRSICCRFDERDRTDDLFHMSVDAPNLPEMLLAQRHWRRCLRCKELTNLFHDRFCDACYLANDDEFERVVTWLDMRLEQTMQEPTTGQGAHKLRHGINAQFEVAAPNSGQVALMVWDASDLRMIANEVVCCNATEEMKQEIALKIHRGLRSCCSPSPRRTAAGPQSRTP